MTMPAQAPWYQHAIFYEIAIRAFKDGNGDGHGDFIGLTSQLDYLQALGVDCLWLLPMYPSPLKDDGYDITDYRAIHPDYGTLADFKAFIAAAHARGLRVITDLVLNHTSDQHPWFQSARQATHSPYRDYYVWSDTPDRYANVRIIFVDVEPANWTWDAQAQQYYWHRFYAHQPDLNYDNPQVQAEMLAVMRYWLDLGVDGFRCDAVTYLFERAGTSCDNLPETHAYIRTLRRLIDDHYPDRVLLAEANLWPNALREYFGNDDEFHMAFNFPLMPRLFLALAQAQAAPISEILHNTPALPPSGQWCTFLRNHDELTLEMVTPAERAFMHRVYAPEPGMVLNLGIRRRLAPLLEGDTRRLRLLNALLFALPGAPIIYYGDEIGMGDNVALPDRFGVRTPMQWEATPTGGFSTCAPERLHLPVVADPAYAPAAVNVAAQQLDPHSLWHFMRQLIALRKQHTAALATGACLVVPVTAASVLVLERRSATTTILVVCNLAAAPQTITVPGYAARLGRELFTGHTAALADPLTVPAYGFQWWLLA